VTTVYFGMASPGYDEANGGDDAEEARWFSMESLPGLGFDHDRIIELILSHL